MCINDISQHSTQLNTCSIYHKSEDFSSNLFVFVIFMVFNFSFLVPEPNVKCIFKFLILVFGGNSNQN